MSFFQKLIPWVRLNLRKKFVLAITLGYALMVAFFVFGLVHPGFRRLEDRVSQTTFEFTRMYAFIAAHHILSEDLPGLRDIVAQASQERNVAYIIIQGPDYRVWASTGGKFDGQYLADEVSAKANRSMEPLVQDLGQVLDISVPVIVGKVKMGNVRLGYSVKELKGWMSAMRQAGVRINIISIALGALMAIFLTWHVTRALGKLTRATRRMAEGDLDHRVEISTRDELEELGRSFNQMAESLKASREKLRRWNEELLKEVERRTAELRASEEKYRGLIEGAGDAIFLIRNEGAEILEANPKAAWLTGLELNRLKGLSLLELVAPEDREALRLALEETFGKGAARNPNLTFRRSGDGSVPVDASFTLMRYDQGLAIQGIFRDISEIKREERRKEALYEISGLVARRESLDQLLKDTAEKLLDYFPLSEVKIYIYKDEAAGEAYPSIPPTTFDYGKVVARREGQEVLTQRDASPKEAVGEPADAAFPLQVQDQEVGLVVVKALSPEGIGLEDLRALRLASNLLAVGIRRSQLGARIAGAKKYLENILESSLDAIVTTDTKGRITYLSRAAEELFRYRASEVLGQSVFRYLGGREGTKIFNLLKKEGKLANFETQVRTKDGQVIPLSLSLSILRDERGGEIGFLGIGKDIRGLKVLQNQLIRAEKMAAVGELASAVAHEVRNPLAGISGAMQVLARDFPPEDHRLQVISELLLQVERLNKAVTNLLDFARPPSLSLAPLDINGLITRTLYLLESSAQDHGIKVNLELAPRLPRVMADRELMKQVFLNITLNAFQAMPRGGQLTITTLHLKGVRPPTLQIKFKDTGVGISPENLKRIFEPFFTTKPGGTGLGLSNSLKIVEQHGGGITVSSISGEGSTFTITLPIKGPEVNFYAQG